MQSQVNLLLLQLAESLSRQSKAQVSLSSRLRGIAQAPRDFDYKQELANRIEVWNGWTDFDDAVQNFTAVADNLCCEGDTMTIFMLHWRPHQSRVRPPRHCQTHRCLWRWTRPSTPKRPSFLTPLNRRNWSRIGITFCRIKIFTYLCSVKEKSRYSIMIDITS